MLLAPGILRYNILFDDLNANNFHTRLRRTTIAVATGLIVSVRVRY